MLNVDNVILNKEVSSFSDTGDKKGTVKSERICGQH